MKSTSANVKFRSQCPIVRTLDVLGDKWTLVIMRDALFFKKRTFVEFERGGEQIPTNLLAARLKSLVRFGLLEKVQYQEHPVRYRYEPTAKAQELKPILRSIRRFGESNFC